MSFFDFSEQDLDLADYFFTGGEVVEFVCLDFNETKNKSLVLDCRVLTGEHAGKSKQIWIDSRENNISKKNRVQFGLAFWSKEELIAKTFHPSKLVNRKFSAVAAPTREHEGKTFQNISNFVDIGPFVGDVNAAAATLNGAAHADAPRF